MFQYKYIEGIQAIQSIIPLKFQHWHKFKKVLALSYQPHSIDEYYCAYTSKMVLLISDELEQYKLELSLYNINGNFNFDFSDGLGSGFAIEELSNTEFEKNFHLYSFEQDIQFDCYCEKIKVVLL